MHLQFFFYDLRLEPNNDKIFIRLSLELFIILPILHSNRESKGKKRISNSCDR